MGGIEEKIYRRQIFKKGINLQVIEEQNKAQADNKSSFLKYFNDNDLFALFEFDFLNCNSKCDTLDMLLEQDGFQVEKTPTLDHHIKFLRNLEVVKGLSLNSNLYSKNEGDILHNQEEEEVKGFDIEFEEEEDYNERTQVTSLQTKSSSKELWMHSPSTQEDKGSAPKRKLVRNCDKQEKDREEGQYKKSSDSNSKT